MPNIPDALKERLVHLATESSVVKGQFMVGEGVFESRAISEDVRDWVVENIIKDAPADVFFTYGGGLQTIRDGNFGPHIDPTTPSGKTRYWNLMYVIATGGDKVMTSFYETPRDFTEQCIKNQFFKIKQENVVLLKKIEEVEFKLNTWNLMNNQIIHSVEGITGVRAGLTIGICTKEIPEFLKKFL